MNGNAYAVIGSNFGDEGKGLFTDFLASKDSTNTIVCRFNGGSQAGHTVLTPEGHRHVFSHFGAGTLAGSDTFLSRFFISNPFTFMTELRALEGHRGDTKVIVDPASLLTTPFDMLMNRAAEVMREEKKEGRHGSVGLGINETVVRSKTDYGTTVADLYETDLPDLLVTIRDEYAPKRLAELGVPGSAIANMLDIWDAETIEKYLDYTARMTEEIYLGSQDIIMGYNNVVFEGAQGLLLDEEHEFFPHVTRSKTGSRNIETICRELGINWVDAIYATRTHMTRHGAGPFPSEVVGMKLEDQTNQPNDWQQTIRFGNLDLDLMIKSVLYDIDDVSDSPVYINPIFGISWFPENEKQNFDVVYGGEIRRMSGEDIAAALSTEFAAHVHVARGKTRDSVEEYYF